MAKSLGMTSVAYVYRKPANVLSVSASYSTSINQSIKFL